MNVRFWVESTSFEIVRRGVCASFNLFEVLRVAMAVSEGKRAQTARDADESPQQDHHRRMLKMPQGAQQLNMMKKSTWRATGHLRRLTSVTGSVTPLAGVCTLLLQFRPQA